MSDALFRTVVQPDGSWLASCRMCGCRVKSVDVEENYEDIDESSYRVLGRVTTVQPCGHQRIMGAV